ncbi:Bifunctional purine biosynthesis protein PurH [Saxophila tyrrhenica]|uniref:Bifunctional purine biosynthesis protein PurH n=1 Tax=Saxophila tyrrhenica TaxID=1690608 RepID=A0AAV9PDT1_9PEZI|nr:Bifunctional purine biosynthesis protein PurH [Saxophila tyrrhenica]
MATRSTLSDLTPYFIFLLLSATLGPLLFGYHLAELNAPSEVITCAADSINPSTLARLKSALSSHLSTSTATAASSSNLPQCIPMDATQLGVVTSFFTLGGLIGALAAGPLTAKVGRVRTMLPGALLATVGPVFEAASPSIAVLALGRFVSGLGADLAPPGHKGLFGSFTQVMVNVGILITQALGLVWSRGQMWRVILGVGGAIGAVQAGAFMAAGMESPRYLAEKGKVGDAKKVLRRIRGKSADIDEEIRSYGVDTVDDDEPSEEERLLSSDTPSDPGMSRTHSNDSPKKPLTFLAIFKHPDTRPAVLAITTVMLAQQLTGINSIIMYGVRLLSTLLAANSALLNVAVSALNVLITASAAPLVDKLGRKTCLLLSIAGMGINSILLAIGIMRSIPALSAIAVVLFVASFGLGLGPVPFILASELVDANAVGAVQSWALAVNWVATFVVAQFFPMLNEAMGKGQVYFVFAAMAGLFGALVMWWVPESKGKTVDEVWGRGKGGTVD